MPVLQLNPVNLTSTDEGYISSITIRSGGSTTVYTPDANEQIGVASALAAAAANRIAGGEGNMGNPGGTGIKLLSHC